MKGLIDKLKNSSITEEEMLKLRNDIFSYSDDELDRQIGESSHHFTFSSNDIKDLKEDINSEISKTARMKRWIIILSTSAAVLIPLLIISLIFIYEGNQKVDTYNKFLSNLIDIRTGKGENSNYILPDGSQIYLRSLSTISYTLGDFNDSERKISFSGEGTFEIVHDKSHPFTVTANGLTIRVLGTNFSLFCREGYDYAEVFLKNGSIILSSSGNQEELKLTPGQKAVVNTTTGAIEILPEGKSKHYISDEPIRYYDAESLETIARELNIYFNQEISIKENLRHITFTGIIPTDDFTSARKILESTMGIKFISLSSSTWQIE